MEKRISIPLSLGPPLVGKLLILKVKPCIYLVNLASRSIKCIVISYSSVKKISRLLAILSPLTFIHPYS